MEQTGQIHLFRNKKILLKDLFNKLILLSDCMSNLAEA